MSQHLTGTRYPAVRVVATVYRILGLLTLFLGVTLGIVSFGLAFGKDVDTLAALIGSITTLLGGIISGVVLLSIGQLLLMFMDIEANTRRTAELLAQSGES